MRNSRRQQRPLAMASSGNLWTPAAHTPEWMKKLWLNCKPESVDERLWARVSEMVGYFNSSDMSPLKEDEDGALGVTLLPTPPNHASARIECSLGTPLVNSQLLRPTSPRPPPTPPNHVSSSTGGGGNEKPSPVKSVVCSPDFPVFQFFPGGEGAVAAAVASGATPATPIAERGRTAQTAAPAAPLPTESPASSTTAPPAKATFQCALCGKVSASKTAHQNHQRAHAKEGDEFPQQRQQAQSQQQQNSPPSGSASAQAQQQDPYPCTICGKTFAVPARLTRHFRTHTGEKPYQCEFCSKAFSVKENLSVHRRIHTKERPYKCDVCARAFEHSGKLHRHARIHTGERPHRCAVCGKTFIQSGQLVIHMRTHTGEKPYVCKSCGKGFTCSKQLKVHTRTHTGEKPYSCEICGKAFGYNHVLKLHQVAHFGEKVYKCTICHETFNSKKTMESHIKSHSGGGASSSSSSSSASSPHCPSQVPPARTPSPPEAASPLSQTAAYSPPPQLPQSSRSPESFTGIQSQRQQPPQQTHEQPHQQPLQQTQQQSHQQSHQLHHQQHHQTHQISSGDYEATSSSTSSVSSAAPSSSSDKENRNCPSVGSEDSEVSRRLSTMATEVANDGHDQQRPSMESPYSNRQQPHDNQMPIHHAQVHSVSPRQLSQLQHQPSSPPTSSYQQQEREVCYYVYQSEGTSDGGIFQSISSPSIGYIQSQGPQSPVATQVTTHHQHVGLSPMLLAAVGLSVEDEEEEDRKNQVAESRAREEIEGRVAVSTPVEDEAVLVVEEEDEEPVENVVHSPGHTVLTVTEPPIYLYPETLGQLQPGVGMVRVRAAPGTSNSPEPTHQHHLHQPHPILRHYSPPYVLPSLPSGENYSSNALPPIAPVTPPGGKRRRGESAPLLTPPSSNPVSPAPSAASSASSESEVVVSAPLPPSAYPASMREVLILPPRKRSKLILQSMEEMRGGGLQLLAPPNSETMQQARVSSVIHYAEKASPAV